MLNAKPIIIKLLILGFTLITILFRSNPVVAGKVEFTPFFRLKESYSDNVSQQKEGGEYEFVTQLMPGFNLRSAGRRALVDVRYELQYTNLSKTERENNAVNHKINADTSINLMRKELVLDASVRRSQDNIVDNTRLPFSEVYNISDPTDVTTTSINPKYQKRFGANGRLLLSYANVHTKYSGSQVDVTSLSTQTYKANLSDMLGNGSIKWQLGYSDINNSENRDAIGLQKKYLMLDFLVGNRVSFFYQAGDEEEFYWLAGFKWTPNKRNNLLASYGNRFFGDTKEFTFNHQNKKTAFRLAYTEQVVDQTILDVENFSRVLLLGEDGLPLRIDGDFQTIIIVPVVSGVFVQKKLQSRFAFTGRKLNVALELAREERINELRDSSEKINGATLKTGWTIAKNLGLVLESGYQKTLFADNIREDKFATNILSLNHTMSNKVTLSYELRHTEFESNDADAGYTENAASVILNMTF